MKIVIIGGTGLIGSKTATLLREKGHQVIAGAPSTGVNIVTGEGLVEALANAHVVVDLTNPRNFEDRAILEFFETSGRNLLAAGAAAGVQHHVMLSIAGADRLQASGYMRGKLAQEALVQSSGIPFTIVRSTQFFEFLGSIAQLGTVGQTVRVSPALMQPIAADDVAHVIADIAPGAPLNGTLEIAGPERLRLNELISRWLSGSKDPRVVIEDSGALYFGAPLNDQSLVPGASPLIGATRFADWLSRG